MYVYYDQTGKITSMCAASSPEVAAPANPGTPLYLEDATYVDVWNHPSHYIIQNGVPVAQPNMSLAVTESSGNYEVTANLNNLPATPPSSATFTVAGQTFTETLTNNTASLTLAIHPSVANQLISVSVSATGCVEAQANIGTGTLLQVGLQVYTPSGGTPTVAPAGPGSYAFLSNYYATQEPTTENVTNMGSLLVLLASITQKLMTAAQSATYTPITLTADELNAWNDMVANLFPQCYVTLANAYPSGKSKTVQYANAVAAVQAANGWVQGFNTAAASIPNLQ